MTGLVFVWIANGNNRLNHQIVRQTEQLFDVLIGGRLTIMIAPAQLHPAAAQAQIGGAQMRDQSGDGTVLDPDITFASITAHHDGQRGVFYKRGPMGFGAGQITENLRIADHHKLPGVEAS